MLSREPNKLVEVGKTLAKIAAHIEAVYDGEAQDIEGALVSTVDGGFKFVLVQTRAQI